jgi:hypothetical protein
VSLLQISQHCSRLPWLQALWRLQNHSDTMIVSVLDFVCYMPLPVQQMQLCMLAHMYAGMPVGPGIPPQWDMLRFA